MDETPTAELPVQPPATFADKCHVLRVKLRDLASQINELHKAPVFLIDPASDPSVSKDHPEMHDNIKLAYRHAEDCVMRLGKAIQAYDGGRSVYPQ